MHVQYDFHGVGQGLFATGRIQVEGADARFDWVYDCGTSSSQAILQQRIADFRSSFANWSPGARPSLGLVVISHFDTDHISGFKTLFGKFSVEVLMLPYLPLEDRLACAFREDVGPDEGLMGFFVNPVRYLLELAGEGSIQRFLFVAPSDERGPDPPNALVPEGGPTGLHINPQPVRDDGESADPDIRDLSRAASAGGAQFDVVQSGSVLSVFSMWEFVPYNDTVTWRMEVGEFRTQVSASVSALRLAQTDDARDVAMTSIRNIYRRCFTSKPKPQNRISLFVYGGPTESASPSFVATWRTPGLPEWPQRVVVIDRRSTSLLYTGDGYLDTPSTLNRLCNDLGAKRVQQILCLQVMHHGAHGNLHRGVAAALNPVFSVFSSNPDDTRYRHPHLAAVREFMNFGPVQVDREASFFVALAVPA